MTQTATPNLDGAPIAVGGGTVPDLMELLHKRLGQGPVLVAAEDQLARAMRSGAARALADASPLAACLPALLSALGWNGQARDLALAMPHFADGLDVTDALNVLANLGYESRTVKIRQGRLDARHLPCLWIAPDQRPFVLLERTGDGWRAFCGTTQGEATLPTQAVDGVLYAPLSPATHPTGEAAADRDNWMGALVRRFKTTLWQLLAVTALLNLLSLAAPLYVMTVYDRVIPTQSYGTLWALVIGITALFAIEGGLRAARTRMVAFVGARLENLIANATFRQLLDLPPAMTVGVPVGAQAARLREFDSIRDLFTGPFVSVVLEAPFVLLFLGVIWWLAGPVVWVPISLMALYIVIGLIVEPTLRRAVQRSAQARAKRHGFLVDFFRSFRAVKQLSAEDLWASRLRDLSADTALGHFKTSQLTQLLQSLAQTMMVAAGVLTVAIGVVQVMNGAATIGALIAVMTLVWRVLAPMQHLFVTLTRFEQVKLSVRQLNQLMRTPTEMKPVSPLAAVQRRLHGTVEFQRVSFRYRNAADPALLGLSFKAEPGQLVAVTGGNGSGKSTVLGLILGLHRPQGGAVLLDGVDLRQIDPVGLRQMIGYAPQEVSLFHGSIAQNLRLGDPLATDDALRDVCAQLGILERIEGLAQGFDTRLGDQTSAHLNAGFRQALSIARALLGGARLILLDEPAQLLDEAADKALIEALQALKGRATIIMVTHRPSHMRLADLILVLDKGQLAAAGPPNEILAASPSGPAA
jgi:ATP-binding cassette, subfamily C, bacterial LapB